MAALAKFSRAINLLALSSVKCQRNHLVLRLASRRHYRVQRNCKYICRRLQHDNRQVCRLLSTQPQLSDKENTSNFEPFHNDPAYYQPYDKFRDLLMNADRRIWEGKPLHKNQFSYLMRSFEKLAQVDRSEARILLESTGSVSAEIPAPTRANYTRWVWQKLKELGDDQVKYDITIYNTYMKMLLNNQDPISPSEAMEEMNSKQLTPNRVTHQLLIASACETGDMEQASTLLEKMKNLDYPVTMQLYNSLIRGYCKNGEMATAEELLKNMSSCNLEPGMTSYRNLMKGYAERLDLDSVKKVLAEAHSANLPMGLNEACDIICIFADGGRTDLALEVFELLSKTVNWKLNIAMIYPSMMTLLHNGHADLAFKLFQAFSFHQAPLFYRAAIVAELPVSQFIDFVRACKKLGMDNSNLSAAIECTNLKAPEYIVELYKHLSTEREMEKVEYLIPAIKYYGNKGDLEGLLSLIPLLDKGDQFQETRCMDYHVYPTLKRMGKMPEEILQLLKGVNTLPESEWNAMMLEVLMQNENLEIVEKELEKMSSIECHHFNKILQSKLSYHLRNANDWKKIFELLKKINDKRLYAGHYFNLFMKAYKMLSDNNMPVEPLIDFMIENKLKIGSDVNPYKVKDADAKRRLKQQMPEEKWNQLVTPVVQLKKITSENVEEERKKDPEYHNVMMYLLRDAAARGDVREVETIVQIPHDPHFKFPSLCKLAMADMYLDKFSDVKLAKAQLDYVLQFGLGFHIPKGYPIKIASLQISNGNFKGALITLKQYATQDDIITLNDVRNIEKLLSLVTPDQKPELIQTLTENRYMARVPSNLTKEAPNLDSEDDLKDMTSKDVLKLFQQLIRKEDKETLQKATDNLSKYHRTNSVLHRLAAAFAIENKIIQARKVCQTPGMRTSVFNEIESVCYDLQNSDVEVSQLEKYHGVVKDAFGLAQKMVLVLILRVIARKSKEKAVEFLENGFTENGIPIPANAYLYLARGFHMENKPIPFHIPKELQDDLDKVLNKGKSRQTTQAPTNNVEKVIAEQQSELMKAPASELLEHQEPAKDIIEQQEQAHELIEQSEPAKEIIVKTEPVKEIIAQSEPVKDVMEHIDPPKDILEKKDS